jgi:chromosome segregation ATPase
MTDMHSEGSPWFWKIFGGTIVGMITLLLITIFGNLRNEISDNKHEFLTQVNELRADIRHDRDSFGNVKERLIGVEQSYSKEKLQGLMQSLTTLTETVNSQKEKLAALETGVSTTKDDIKAVREESKDIAKQVQEVREKVAALTPAEIKKENPATVEKP